MLSSVFCFKVPETFSSSVLKDLVRSCKMETPVPSVCPPSWNLDAVLRYRISSTFEPLASTPLSSLMKKVLFLLGLGKAKWVGELQTWSRHVSFSLSGACIAYVLEFLAKTESAYIPFLTLS